MSLNVTFISAMLARLERNEARFRQIFESLPVGVGLADRDYEWVRVNPALCEFFGYSEEELLGKSLLEHTDEADILPTVAQARRLQQDADEFAKFEQRFRHKDGTLLWADVTAMPLHTDGGPPEYFLGLIVDITCQKQLEHKLQDTEKMHVIGQMAGGVAHDFNNLLTVIESFAKHLLEEHGETVGERFALEKILGAAQRGSKLTEQMLAFSRRAPHDPRRVQLAAIVDDVAGMVERLLGEAIALHVDMTRGDLWGWIDPGQLEQALINLVFNARDAMPDGGELNLDLRRFELDEAHCGAAEEIPPGDYALLEVRDNGDGIPPEVLERIFEPFYTTKPAGKGTGLGLSSAWGIIKQADGFIDVDSRPGEGATFRIYLPLADPA